MLGSQMLCNQIIEISIILNVVALLQPSARHLTDLLVGGGLCTRENACTRAHKLGKAKGDCDKISCTQRF